MKTKKMPLFILALTMASLLFGSMRPAGASDYSDVLRNVPDVWRADVERVLNLASAEWNDIELIEALETYPPGTPKHRAVCYLVANMDKHLYVDYVNPLDPLNPFSPEDASIDWLREYIWDYSTMTSALIIENVEWAFVSRETFAWCRELSEDMFFQYVLPYRSTQEPVHSWRPMMYETYSPIVATAENSLIAAWLINSHNSQIFGFDPLYYRHPEDRDIPTLLSCGLGRCEDMSNLSNYSMRAVGIPTTSDFTPWWPKGDNNHAWNVVYYGNRWYQFMGCEAGTEPVWDTIKSSIFAKVYRESYSANPIMGDAPDGTQPPRLMRIAAYDVTSEYTTESDLDIEVQNPTGATFLCVFNYGDWRAVGGVWADGANVHFNDVGNQDILYCATRYIEDEIGWGTHLPVATPFILHRDGSLEYISPCPSTEGTGDIVLTGWSSTSGLDEGSEVSLFKYVGNPQAFEVNPAETEEVISPMVWELVATVAVSPAGTVVEGENIDGIPTATFPAAATEGGLYLLSDSESVEEFREGSRPFVWTANGISYY